jgi:hypothetical protein
MFCNWTTLLIEFRVLLPSISCFPIMFVPRESLCILPTAFQDSPWRRLQSPWGIPDMFYINCSSMGLFWRQPLSLALDPVLNDLPKLIGMPAIGDYPSILAPSIHVIDPFLSTIICLWKHPFVDFIFLLRTCLKASASAIFGIPSQPSDSRASL